MPPKYAIGINASGDSHYLDLIRHGSQLARGEQKLAFGESLPRGRRIE